VAHIFFINIYIIKTMLQTVKSSIIVKTFLIALILMGLIQKNTWAQNNTMPSRPDSVFLNDKMLQDEKIGHQKTMSDSSDRNSTPGRINDNANPSRSFNSNKDSLPPRDTTYMNPSKPKYPKDSIP
jgi:hypothetical protein